MPTKRVDMKMIDQYLVRGELKPGGKPVMIFEDFVFTMKEALESATVEDMIIVTMPNGDEYTILKRPGGKHLAR